MNQRACFISSPTLISCFEIVFFQNCCFRGAPIIPISFILCSLILVLEVNSLFNVFVDMLTNMEHVFVWIFQGTLQSKSLSSSIQSNWDISRTGPSHCCCAVTQTCLCLAIEPAREFYLLFHLILYSSYRILQLSVYMTQVPQMSQPTYFVLALLQVWHWQLRWLCCSFKYVCWGQRLLSFPVTC